MKPSLAERQAALLRQNAEVNERVEAIEQCHLLRSVASSGSRSGLLSVVQSEVEAKDVDDDGSQATDSESIPMATNSRMIARGALSMELSASIDSFGSLDQPQSAEAEAHGKKASSSAATKTRSSRTKPQAKRRESKDAEQGESSPKGNSEDGNGDEVALVPEGLGVDATIRYQKARLRVLQDQVVSSAAHIAQMQTAHTALKAQLDDLKAENAAIVKKSQQTQLLLDKQRELSAAQDAKQGILESQLAAANARINEIERAEKQTSQQFRSKDVRLNRALEELEKLKAQQLDEKRAQGEHVISKSEHESVIKENKRLEKQKNELLVAFKKQMKLIDLLKRQRIHMEAAKMLSFTEEEFSKTLELG